MKAIFRKELRDLLPWIPLGIILIGVLCWYVAPRGAYNRGVSIEFSLSGLVGGGCMLVAMAFGFLQSIPDTRTEAKGYLLHRPIPVAQIFWAKLLAGGAAYLLCLMPPLFVLVCYLEMKGPQTLPTSGLQVLPLMILSVIFFAMHPAAMWTIYREARWVGSKCFPLGFALIGSFLSYTFLAAASSKPSPYAFCGMIVLTSTVAITGALHAFCNDQFLPPPGNERRTSRFGNFGLLVVSFALFMIVVMAGSSLMRFGPWNQQAQSPPTSYQVAFSEDGAIWELAETADRPYHLNPNYELSGRRITATSQDATELTSLPEGWKERIKASFTNYDLSSTWPNQFKHITYVNAGNMQGYVWEHRGRLYVYDPTGGLVAVITPRGFFTPDESADGKFERVRNVYSSARFSGQYAAAQSPSLGGIPLIADANGIYQLDVAARTIRTVIDQPLDNFVLVLPRDDQEGLFWLLRGGKLTRHVIKSIDPNALLELADSKTVAKARQYELPVINASLSDEWTIDPLDPNNLYGGLSVAETAHGVTAFIRNTYARNEPTTYEIYNADQSLRDTGSVELRRQPVSSGPAPMALLPPATWVFEVIMDRGFTGTLGLGLAAHGLLAVAIAFRLGGTLGLSIRSRTAWSIIAAGVGISTPLAMLAIYPRLIREPCPHCEVQRRIDKNQCSKCGSEWERLPMDGTEIIGARARNGLLSAIGPQHTS